MYAKTCKETGTYPGSVGQQHNGVMYATPVWVEKAGAKGTVTGAWGTRNSIIFKPIKIKLYETNFTFFIWYNPLHRYANMYPPNRHKREENR